MIRVVLLAAASLLAVAFFTQSASSLGLGREGRGFGKLGAGDKRVVVVQPTGDILLVDGTSFILQTDGASLICRAGGC